MSASSGNLNPGQFEISSRMKTIYSVFIFIGVLAFAVGIIRDQERMWNAYLVSFFFFLSLGLGGLFFTAVNNVTNTGWNVNVRRFSEALTSFLPIGFVGMLVFLFGAQYLYPWMDAERVAADPLLAVKTPYLNMKFFIIRVIIFFGGWLLFSKLIVGNSLKQDESGDAGLTKKNHTFSVMFILFFAVSYSFLTVDILMSLLPHWYSTIFGVYCFAGLFQSSMAMMILFTLYSMKKNYLNGLVSLDHIHDMAKYMKAFTVFWAYIAFSQFMLIWYANIPEETEYFLERANGGWMAVSLGLIIFKFIVPFLALLPRWAKRTPSHLVGVCILILFMQVVDVYWMVYPNYNHHHLSFGYLEIGLFLGFLGLFLMSVNRFLNRNRLVPAKDPRQHESLSHHVTY